jgi:acyl-CoA oxidase
VLKRTAAQTIMQTILDTRQDNEEEGSLFNRGTQVKMFEDREEYMLASVARRLQGKSKEMSPFEAFNAVQDHVLHTAQTHIDRIVLEAFVAASTPARTPRPARSSARSATSTHCRSSRVTRRGSSSTVSCRPNGPRPSPVPSTTAAVCSGRTPRPWSTGSGIPEQLRYAEMLHPSTSRMPTSTPSRTRPAQAPSRRNSAPRGLRSWAPGPAP